MFSSPSAEHPTEFQAVIGCFLSNYPLSCQVHCSPVFMFADLYFWLFMIAFVHLLCWWFNQETFTYKPLDAINNSSHMLDISQSRLLHHIRDWWLLSDVSYIRACVTEMQYGKPETRKSLIAVKAEKEGFCNAPSIDSRTENLRRATHFCSYRWAEVRRPDKNIRTIHNRVRHSSPSVIPHFL